jgi:arylsulfatase
MAARSRLRALLRFLDALTDPFLSRPRPRQPSRRSAEDAGGRLPPDHDLIDHAIAFVRDQVSASGERPFFLYVPFGTAHCPHQAPQAFLDKYRGTYDEGWDVIRQPPLRAAARARHRPAGHRVSRRNDGVPAWDSLSADEKLVAARLQEAFAAMVDHTDHELARLVACLREIGRYDNTIFVVLADNGASQEGGAGGTTNIVAYENGQQPSLEFNSRTPRHHRRPAQPDQLSAGLGAGRQYAAAPLQAEHACRRHPCAARHRVGSGLAGNGEIRTQFHHAIDIVPTLLGPCGRRGARDVQRRSATAGARRQPALLVHRRHGAHERGRRSISRCSRTARSFTTAGRRCPFHRRGRGYEDDAWELYRLDTDFSECRDLARSEPQVLERLVAQWWVEAGKYGVLPLDDRGFPERAVRYQSKGSPRLRNRFSLYPGMSRIPSGAAPVVRRSLVSHRRASASVRIRTRRRRRVARRPLRRLHAVRARPPARVRIQLRGNALPRRKRRFCGRRAFAHARARVHPHAEPRGRGDAARRRAAGRMRRDSANGEMVHLLVRPRRRPRFALARVGCVRRRLFRSRPVRWRAWISSSSR